MTVLAAVHIASQGTKLQAHAFVIAVHAFVIAVHGIEAH